MGTGHLGQVAGLKAARPECPGSRTYAGAARPVAAARGTANWARGAAAGRGTGDPPEAGRPGNPPLNLAGRPGNPPLSLAGRPGNPPLSLAGRPGNGTPETRQKGQAGRPLGTHVAVNQGGNRSYECGVRSAECGEESKKPNTCAGGGRKPGDATVARLAGGLVRRAPLRRDDENGNSLNAEDAENAEGGWRTAGATDGGDGTKRQRANDK